jgi:hypothetical protein
MSEKLVVQNPRDLMKAWAMDIGKQVAHHIETMYPEAVKAASSTFLLSVRNLVHNEVIAAMESKMDLRERLDYRAKFRKWIRAQYKSIRRGRAPQQDDGIIRGKDAEEFLKRMYDAVLTPEREAWLKECAEASKKAADGDR